MQVRVILLVLQTLRHFNSVLDSIQRSTCNLTSEYGHKDIDKKLKKEIKRQKEELKDTWEGAK